MDRTRADGTAQACRTASFLDARDYLPASESRHEPLGPRRPAGGGWSQNAVEATNSAAGCLVEQHEFIGRPEGRYSGGGVGAGIVVKGQSGRACAEPASRP